MSQNPMRNTRGPFRAEQIRPGDPYELSNGHTIQCMPTGGRGALATGAGYKALADDPAVEDIGIDAGFAPVGETMRAPDLSIGKIADAPGWVHGIPELAVEYADTGQNEDDLDQKIVDLLAAGTKYIWVVRLSGPRRVEIHEPNLPMRKALPGEELAAPGVLEHPVRVEALYDLDVARDVNLRHVLRNLTGHETVGAIRDEGKAEAKAEGILAVLEARGVAVGEDDRKQILSCRDLQALERWLRRAATAASVGEVIHPG
jgi:Uma2 family endonuclease